MSCLPSSCPYTRRMTEKYLRKTGDNEHTHRQEQHDECTHHQQWHDRNKRQL